MKNFPWLNKPFLEPMKNLLRLFVFSLLAIVALPSFAIMKYATITNDLPVDATYQVGQGGAVFGGSAVVPSQNISAGATVNASLDVTNDNNLKVYASVSAFASGGGQFNGYYCLKSSDISIADARNQACGPSVYRPTTVNTNGSGYSSVVYVVISRGSAPECPSTTVYWGAGNYCSATTGATPNGSSVTINNSSVGAVGSATLSCNTTYTVQPGATCAANIPTPSGLVATDGASTSINITWNAITGASQYRLQQRKQGTSTWADLSVAGSTSTQWNAPDEAVYEFQVRGENAVGASAWSSIDTGWIRPSMAPVFVSQSGIPARIGVGQSFSFSQVWANNGSLTWTGSTFGTAAHTAAGANTWGVNFTAFPGSTATGAQVTSTMTATAPAVPGTYTLQREMQRSGVRYGNPSTPVSVVVLDTPTCSAVNTDVSTTYNPNGTITASLVGPSSVETAIVRVWGDLKGEGAGIDYAFAFNGSNWVANFPVAPHLSPNEVKLNLKASVANSVFSSRQCATGAVTFQQLPIPVVTVTPTFGTYGDASRQGYVVNRAGGEFAKVNVDLGSFSSTLKARVEVLDASNTNLIVSLNGVNPNQPNSVQMSSTTMAAASVAWQQSNATLRVSYSDTAAAAQGKVALIPISWAMAPGALNVSASGITAATPTVKASISPVSGTFSTDAHGPFTGYLKVAPNAGMAGASQTVANDGTWTVANLDYGTLYAAQLIAVARANPPAGITLFAPLEFASAPFGLPVQAPLSVAATDGTREDDIQIVWPPVATGSAIRYRLYRDGVEITSPSGISAVEFIDTPPERGTTYTYSVKTMINNIPSLGDVSDPGFVPACRAARLVGASLNADMSAINGLIEQWSCLDGAVGSGAVDAGASVPVAFVGRATYRGFSHPIEKGFADGPHVLKLNIESKGVSINANRTYDIPFNLGRSSITLKSLTILYDGATAQPGLEASSIGRFGVKMDGGSGLGFAEEIK